MALENKTVLVTGGLGMIGSVLVRRLAQEVRRVVVLDDSSAYPFNQLERFLPDRAAHVELVQGSICDTSAVRKALKDADLVVHAAAFADVGACIRDYATDFETNVRGTFTVLTEALERRVDRFVFISSASVYGDPNSGTPSEFREEGPTLPLSTYANSKLWGEHQCKLYHDLYGLPTVSLRLFSIYGVPQVPKEGSHSWCVAIFTMRALQGMPLRVFGDGSQVRDFVNVKDVTEAILKALTGRNVEGKSINVGTGLGTPVAKVAELVRERVAPVAIEYAERPRGDPVGGYASVSLIRRLLGWEPRIDLSEGIDEYIAWAKAHPELTPSWLHKEP